MDGAPGARTVSHPTHREGQRRDEWGTRRES